MFGQRKAKSQSLPLARPSQGLDLSDPPTPRFDHPQIMVLDGDDITIAGLRDAGYRVVAGSFGTPYKVPKRDGIWQLIMNGRLPSNFAEQEIVIADLAPQVPLDHEVNEPPTAPRQDGWWSRNDTGVVDPRPALMAGFQGDFDRILAHGGVFVLFAAARYDPDLSFGRVVTDVLGRERFQQDPDIPCDNWSILSVLASYNLDASFATGQDIRPIEATNVRVVNLLSRAIAEHLSEARFTCTLQPRTDLQLRWITLAKNKYGKAVAGLVAPSQQGEGVILILPNLSDRPRFLTRLLADVLPDLSPHLFPHVEGARWVERPEYELPGVVDLQQRVRRVEEEARAQVVALEEQIAVRRQDLGHLHELLTQHDRPLVEAVKRTLETLGFQNLIDVDAETRIEGQSDKDEDLRLEDGSPILLVEVKGVRGTSTDDDALQVAKHLLPRAKKLGRTDINGLTIINHQRHIPALERTQDPFRDLVLTSAAEQDVGLLTTWDLYRLARGFLRNGWTHENIRGLFFRPGRIHPIPDHYQSIGTVERFWDNFGVVSVHLSEGPLALHDRIAFEFTVEFEEEVVESLQVDRQPVDAAPQGSLVGIKTSMTKDKMRAGTRVYRVRPRAQDPSRADIDPDEV